MTRKHMFHFYTSPIITIYGYDGDSNDSDGQSSIAAI